MCACPEHNLHQHQDLNASRHINAVQVMRIDVCKAGLASMDARPEMKHSTAANTARKCNLQRAYDLEHRGMGIGDLCQLTLSSGRL